MSRRNRRALVVGGSLGGLFAANMLRQVCSRDVDVFERVENDLAARGAGIATHDEMFHVMRKLGLFIDESYGIDVTKRVCFGKSGEIVYEYPMRRKMSAWARFCRPLKDLLPEEHYHFGKTLVDIEQQPDRVTAVFSDGTRAEGDFTDWCRRLPFDCAFADHARAGAPVRGLHRVARYGRGTSDPVRAACRPVRAAHRWPDWVALRDAPLVRPAGRAVHDDLSGPRTGQRRAPRAPPVELRVVSPHARRRPLAGLCTDALLGDSAFVARPHVGMGTTKAALDARYLTDAIARSHGDLVAALHAYDDAARRFGSRVVARGRWLGAHLEAQVTKPRTERTAHELTHMPVDTLFGEVGAALADIPELAELT